MTTFTHRATGLPGGEPETDRSVLHNGRVIGRVVQIEGGTNAGQWNWSCLWVGDDTRGRVATLDEALDAIKSRVTPAALAQLPPARRQPK